MPFPSTTLPATDGAVHTSYALMILHYCYLYGCQMVLFAILSAMAAFRRELSSNRVYMDHEEGIETAEARRICGNDLSSKARSAWRRGLVILEEDAADIDDMLEGAGNIYGPIFTLSLAVWARVTLARYNVFSQFGEGGKDARKCNSGNHGGSPPEKYSSLSDSRTDSEGGDSNPRGGGCGRNHDEDVQLGSVGAASAEEDGEVEFRSMVVLDLPPDALIHVLSFLHPHDVVNFACVSRGSHRIVDDETLGEDGNSTSLLLWKELWRRDYAWVVCEWDVGKQALSRSMGFTSDSPSSTSDKLKCQRMSSVFKHLESSIVDDIIDEDVKSSCCGRSSLQTIDVTGNAKLSEGEVEVKVTHMSMKDFYFTFGQAWLNYTLAGQNSNSRCLIGLHGHVFDITDFFEQHPGSPETLLVQSGRDATHFFEDLGHSVGARKMAMTMCVVLDRSCAADGGAKCGLLKPGDKNSIFTISSRKKLPKRSWARSKTARDAIPMARSKARRPGTLHRVRAKLDGEEQNAHAQATKWLSNTLTREGILGDVHVYYDVFIGRWMVWYTNFDFQPEFVDLNYDP
mmetsp:Transcript_26745/g.79006  ORF Transcript_26745/g.79006 Transcript_26745/m.79006 type:complete len:570 (-) Transcript_26745:107-1816(-)